MNDSHQFGFIVIASGFVAADDGVEMGVKQFCLLISSSARDAGTMAGAQGDRLRRAQMTSGGAI